MKKLLTILLLASGLQSYSKDCRDLINEAIQEKKEKRKSVRFIVRTASATVGVGLIIAFPPVGVPAVFLANTISEGMMSVAGMKKLKTAINEAYSYRANQNEGKYLRKLIKKIKKANNTQSYSTDVIVESIIDSNEKLDLCQPRSIGSYADKISITKLDG